MRPPREPKSGSKKPFKARAFLEFIHKNIDAVLKEIPPQTGFFTKNENQHPLVKVKQDLGILFKILDMEKNREKANLDKAYDNSKALADMTSLLTSSTVQSSDNFSKFLTEIAQLGKENQNPEINYFYEFANNKFAQYEGKNPDYIKSTQEKYDFLIRLRPLIINFYKKYKPGESSSVDMLCGIIKSVDLTPNLKKASGQLVVYKAFHQCQNLLKKERKSKVEDVETVFQTAASFLRFHYDKPQTDEDIIGSFTMIAEELERKQIAQEQPTKNSSPPPLPPRRKRSIDSSAPIPILSRAEITTDAASSPQRPLPTPLDKPASPPRSPRAKMELPKKIELSKETEVPDDEPHSGNTPK